MSAALLLHRDAVPALIEVLRSMNNSIAPGWYCEATAKALGKIGPRAKATLPQLKELAQDESEYLADAAQEAIRKIEGGRAP